MNTDNPPPNNNPKSERADNVHTALNFRDGGINTFVTFIDPPNDTPVLKGLRYQIKPWTLGKLEALAKSRFVVSDLAHEEDVSDWTQVGESPIETIVQSVLASNAIEGETVYLREAEIQGAAETALEDGEMTEEWKKRRRIGDEMYQAYIFALKAKRDPILSVDFILTLHKKMFSRLYPDTAGRTKKEAVVIKGGGYHIQTVPPGRADRLLKSIVSEFNKKWKESQEHAEHCSFLLIAEFIVDFLAVHPFEDGNGRMARLLSTYLLEKSGYHFARFYSLDNIIQEKKQQYYHALYRAQKAWFREDEDLTDWVEYYIEIVYIQWKRAFENLKNERIKRQRHS